ncbi:MAG: hypothetical protein JWO09_1511 [Bacteroidetes bacterium]|nr:hypothetical protein [Bacteroidota bacterium]
MQLPSLELLEAVFKRLRYCKDREKRINDLLKELSVTGITFTHEQEIQSCLINVLEDAFDDKDGLIEWYIAENNFGRNNLSRDVNGKKTAIETVEQLHGILVTSYAQRTAGHY